MRKVPGLNCEATTRSFQCKCDDRGVYVEGKFENDTESFIFMVMVLNMTKIFAHVKAVF